MLQEEGERIEKKRNRMSLYKANGAIKLIRRIL
jgi:hypothetical protein